MSQETAAPDISLAVKKWRKKRGNLIMILHEIQDHHGHVPRGVALEIARQLGVPLARIYEVLTFYNYFKLDPPGRFVVSVCMGTACYLKGAGKILERLSEELNVNEGETTEDGMFHVQGVRCVGCCGLAPVVMVNGEIYSRVEADNVPKILNSCRQSGGEA